MGLRFFSDKNRPTHLGPYPVERLLRTDSALQENNIPAFVPLRYHMPNAPHSIVNGMREHQAMLDAIRDGLVNKSKSDCPNDVQERSKHLKSFAYFADASVVGMCKLNDRALLPTPIHNPDVEKLANDLRTRQTKTLASGIDMIMADLKESMDAPPSSIDGHSDAIVFLYEYPRDPTPDEPGCDWIIGAQAHRAGLLAAETAVVLANYIRLLGFHARAHTVSCSDVDLNALAVTAGLCLVEGNDLVNPYLGNRFGLGAVTTTMLLHSDKPLAPSSRQRSLSTHGVQWQLGIGTEKGALNHVPFAKRRFVDGEQPFEKLKRVERPTTYIDEARVARVPKRTDMFARAQFGDMGVSVQNQAKGGHYVRKSATAMAQRRALGAFVLLQDGDESKHRVTLTPQQASELVKATSYFLGVDAVGISRCPDWAWYSHDAKGDVIDPPHDQAISMIIDQGYSTMEGSSGDDWIAVSQSMRAYLRFSLLGGVLAKQLRNLGYSAKAHSVMDGEVLQPPLLLLSGLGEVSRIGEVVLNPFLGPRLKSGAVTTNLPMEHDKPIDFGLQRFCESCNKCARECPSGAITAGPKLMFNGYEIWKSDSQKCATYRLSTPGGAMCGRCMKTCPWNLEGLFKEKPFRWAAMNIPGAAPLLARLDDAVGNGELNPIKKWWWDIEIQPDGAYKTTEHPVNTRGLQRDLRVKYEDQTLAVYPANLAPHPYPYPFPMDRDKGIEAYQAMITAEEYQRRIDCNETDSLEHQYSLSGESPVIQVELVEVDRMSADISRYVFAAVDGNALPKWSAGAHIDIVVAPEFLRQYSMSGNPENRSRYEIGVLREPFGRGGSELMHRIFSKGRKLFISKPINHFPLHEDAAKTYLFGGGIGITPLIAMAHRLHAIGADFDMHYSGRSRNQMGYIQQLADFEWANNVALHITEENTRADFKAILQNFPDNAQLYLCGSDPYMQALQQDARAVGFPEEQTYLEYFSVPETPEWVNHAFKLRIHNTGRTLEVPADKSASDVLNEAGVQVDVKCSDGLCGVCKCELVSGDVEHRDFVLSKAQRRNSIILCQSRAAQKNGVIEIKV